MPNNTNPEIIMVGHVPLIAETEGIFIDARECYKLVPGDRITVVGTPGKGGGETSASRVDAWDPYITYRGLSYLFLGGLEGCPYMIFELPPGGITRYKKPCNDIFYVPYVMVHEGELGLQNFRTNTARWYRAIFNHYSTT